MNRNRFVYVLLMALICLMVLPGCASKGTANDKISVVCTIFPEFDWTSQIIGEHAEDFDIVLLTDNGTDMHSYQVTVADLAKVSSCDVFIYVGGESDAWIDEAIAGAVNKDMKVVNLLEVLGDGAKEEEIIEGMAGEEAESEDDGPEYDEHVWLSIRNSKLFVDAIASAIVAAEPSHAEDYLANARNYNAELDRLDSEYSQVVDGARVKTLLFADRFPFRYLVDDYGLDYYAAFSGCSAETEASFSTITFLAEKMDECGLGTILILEGSDSKIAGTVADTVASGDKQILVIDSLQSTTASEIEAGKTYISVMKSNLDILKAALY